MIDALGNPQSILLLGGTSELGLATAELLAAPRNATIIRTTRPGSDPLHTPRAREGSDPPPARAGSLGGAGESVVPEPLSGVALGEGSDPVFDAADVAGHARFVEQVFDAHGDIDVVLVAFGLLDAEDPLDVVDVNYRGAVSVLVHVAERMRAQGHGAIVVFSSVAGERARRANYLYGSTKAGLDAFAQGLHDDLRDAGVHVLTVRPGFVHTKMTEGREPAPFSTTPDVVAKAVADGLRRRAHTVWAPAQLRYLMAVLRHLPRPVFRRLGER